MTLVPVIKEKCCMITAVISATEKFPVVRWFTTGTMQLLRQVGLRDSPLCNRISLHYNKFQLKGTNRVTCTYWWTGS